MSERSKFVEYAAVDGGCWKVEADTGRKIEHGLAHFEAIPRTWRFPLSVDDRTLGRRRIIAERDDGMPHLLRETTAVIPAEPGWWAEPGSYAGRRRARGPCLQGAAGDGLRPKARWSLRKTIISPAFNSNRAEGEEP